MISRILRPLTCLLCYDNISNAVCLKVWCPTLGNGTPTQSAAAYCELWLPLLTLTVTNMSWLSVLLFSKHFFSFAVRAVAMSQTLTIVLPLMYFVTCCWFCGEATNICIPWWPKMLNTLLAICISSCKELFSVQMPIWRMGYFFIWCLVFFSSLSALDISLLLDLSP